MCTNGFNLQLLDAFLHLLLPSGLLRKVVPAAGYDVRPSGNNPTVRLRVGSTTF